MVKIKRITAIIFTLCLVALAWPQKAKGEAKIELITVYEKTFEDTIVDVIFDTATVTIEEAKKMGWKEEGLSREEIRKEKVTVSYPKVIFISDEFYPDDAYRIEARIYDKRGKLVKTITTSYHKENFIFSESGEYILLGKLAREQEPSWKGGSLYKKDGTLLFEKGIEGGFFKEISNVGYVAAVTDFSLEAFFYGDIVIYNQNGQKVKEIENPYRKDMGYAMAKFSRKGEHLLINFTKLCKESNLILASKESRILWSKTYPYECMHGISEVDIVEGVGVAGIFDEYKRGPLNMEIRKYYSFYIDWKGNLKWTVPLEIRGNMIVKISEDKEKVYVVSTEGYLWCIDVNNGRFLWRHKEPWAPKPGEKWPSEVPLFYELEITNDTLYIIGKQGRDWHSSALFIFDGKTGNLIKKLAYPQEKITFVKTDKEKLGLINRVFSKVSG